LDENENILISGNTCSDSYSSFDKLSKVSIFLLINIVNFVYKQILENLTYKKNIFLNYTLSLFLLILFCNVMGLVPYSLTVTSYLIVALYLSGMSFFANLIIGIRVYS
jgi:F0F1-type ATP synthase membrane subunit a